MKIEKDNSISIGFGDVSLIKGHELLNVVVMAGAVFAISL